MNKVHKMAIPPSHQRARLARHYRQFNSTWKNMVTLFFFFSLRSKQGVMGNKRWRRVREFSTQKSTTTLVVFHFIDISKFIRWNSACRRTINLPSMQLLPKQTTNKQKMMKTHQEQRIAFLFIIPMFFRLVMESFRSSLWLYGQNY